VPPRADDEASSVFTLHSRSNSWEDVEALGGAGLARSESIGRQTMFERSERDMNPEGQAVEPRPRAVEGVEPVAGT